MHSRSPRIEDPIYIENRKNIDKKLIPTEKVRKLIMSWILEEKKWKNVKQRRIRGKNSEKSYLKSIQVNFAAKVAMLRETIPFHRWLLLPRRTEPDLIRSPTKQQHSCWIYRRLHGKKALVSHHSAHVQFWKKICWVWKSKAPTEFRKYA